MGISLCYRLHKEYAMCVRSVGMISCSHDAGDWLLEKTKSSSNAVSNLLNCPDWTPRMYSIHPYHLTSHRSDFLSSLWADKIRLCFNV